MQQEPSDVHQTRLQGLTGRATGIVKVKGNSVVQLPALFASLAARHDGRDGRATVVDNGSNDDALAQLAAATDLPFDLVVAHNRENRGFAAACNRGARLATTQFLLFHNPDTLLFPVGARALNLGGGISRQVVAQRLLYSLRSRSNFAAKYFAAHGQATTPILTLAIEPWTRLTHAILRQDGEVAGATLAAYRMLVPDPIRRANRAASR